MYQSNFYFYLWKVVMFRKLLMFSVFLTCAQTATAQQAEGPSLRQLELSADGDGYAVVIDEDGHEYHCKAEETRDSVDLGPCKPLRLVTPLDMQSSAFPPMNPAKRRIVDLFEQSRCRLDYATLRDALESLDTRDRQAAARVISEMTDRGEIIDDEGRERAVLRIGDICS